MTLTEAYQNLINADKKLGDARENRYIADQEANQACQTYGDQSREFSQAEQRALEADDQVTIAEQELTQAEKELANAEDQVTTADQAYYATEETLKAQLAKNELVENQAHRETMRAFLNLKRATYAKIDDDTPETRQELAQAENDWRKAHDQEHKLFNSKRHKTVRQEHERREAQRLHDELIRNANGSTYRRIKR